MLRFYPANYEEGFSVQERHLVGCFVGLTTNSHQCGLLGAAEQSWLFLKYLLSTCHVPGTS
jgi:hypothetical protein